MFLCFCDFFLSSLSCFGDFCLVVYGVFLWLCFCSFCLIFMTLFWSLSSRLAFSLPWFHCFCPVVHGSTMVVHISTYYQVLHENPRGTHTVPGLHEGVNFTNPPVCWVGYSVIDMVSTFTSLNGYVQSHRLWGQNFPIPPISMVQVCLREEQILFLQLA